MRTDPAWTLDLPLLEVEEGSEGIGHFRIYTPPHTRWVSLMVLVAKRLALSPKAGIFYTFRKFINQHEYELEVTWSWF
jgi:hypothetical protein